MIWSSSRWFDPPWNRTFSHGGRASPFDGGAGLSGRMLNGAAISKPSYPHAPPANNYLQTTKFRADCIISLRPRGPELFIVDHIRIR